MKVNELMTPDPACCTPQTKLTDVARMMVGFNTVRAGEPEGIHRTLSRLVMDGEIESFSEHRPEHRLRLFP